MRISSERFYVAEEDENIKGEPTIWVVSKDEKQSHIFAKKNNFWVLVNSDSKLEYFNYLEIRELIKDL